MQEAVLDPLTQMYTFPDGTQAPAEVVDNVECMLDIFNIYDIRYDNNSTQKNNLRRLRTISS